jgi:hypothetical protein
MPRTFRIAENARCDDSTSAIRKYFKRALRMDSVPPIVLLFKEKALTNTLTDAQKSDIMEFLTGKSYSV